MQTGAGRVVDGRVKPTPISPAACRTSMPPESPHAPKSQQLTPCRFRDWNCRRSPDGVDLGSLYELSESQQGR